MTPTTSKMALWNPDQAGTPVRAVLARIGGFGGLARIGVEGTRILRRRRSPARHQHHAVRERRSALQLARSSIVHGWPLRRRRKIQRPCPDRSALVRRCQELGEVGLDDRTSPPPLTCLHRTRVRTERHVLGLRTNRRWGPARIAYHLPIHGRVQGEANSQARNLAEGRPKDRGCTFLHHAVDHHSRFVYSEILPDETEEPRRPS